MVIYKTCCISSLLHWQMWRKNISPLLQGKILHRIFIYFSSAHMHGGQVRDTCMVYRPSSNIALVTYEHKRNDIILATSNKMEHTVYNICSKVDPNDQMPYNILLPIGRRNIFMFRTCGHIYVHKICHHSIGYMWQDLWKGGVIHINSANVKVHKLCMSTC